MGATKFVKCQKPRCTGLNVSIFRIRPITRDFAQNEYFIDNKLVIVLQIVLYAFLSFFIGYMFVSGLKNRYGRSVSSFYCILFQYLLNSRI